MPSPVGRCRQPPRTADRPPPRHRVHAGEGAEGRQHADARAEVETRQSQPVAAAAAQHDARVHMAGQREAPSTGCGWWHSARPPTRSGSSTMSMPARRRVAGGRSWLPRTSVMASAAWRWRQARSAASVPTAWARAECSRSPRKTSRARRWRRSAHPAGPARRRWWPRAPARRGGGTTPPCRGGRRPPAAGRRRAAEGAFCGSSAGGRSPPALGCLPSAPAGLRPVRRSSARPGARWARA